MRRHVDKRAVFFLAAAGLCVLILPVTPSAYRTVGIVLVITYLVLAVASWLDYRTRGVGKEPSAARPPGRPKGSTHDEQPRRH
jgi:hypothetical protein